MSRVFIYEELELAVAKYGLFTDKRVMDFCKHYPEEINFCGAKQGVKVFDTMYGLFIGWSCAIHDGMFALIARDFVSEIKTGVPEPIAFARLQAQVKKANAMMLANTVLIIAKESNWLTVLPRCYRACTYFLGTHYGGENAIMDTVEELRAD